MVFNCGFNNPTLITYNGKLKFECIESMSEVRKYISDMFKNNPSQKKINTPALVVKYRGRKRTEYCAQDFFDKFPDFSMDFVLQKYVPPKGLKAIKYRVVLKNFSKVYIYSNKIRIDAKTETFSKKIKQSQDFSVKNLEKTLTYHKQILKSIKNNQTIQQFSELTSINYEKLMIYNLFRKDKKIVDKKHSISLKGIRPSTRFFTHEDIEKTSLFEGKNQSFSGIISATEYLRDKIDSCILENQKIIELAVDFLQDCNGNWILLKIKYGKTTKKKIDCASTHEKPYRKKLILRSDTRKTSIS